ncbi:putative CDC48-associated ubiquitin-like zinc finger protein [Clavispora lusitaniae]|uniref:CDC48-associated ubiquitin-like zinc finger protein n=1 Tax=Clavispora lusitaniae TaxID=36911 RepID=A0ACD0WE93_CLALS|nr:putative CDC48-associated ubiquitin-like zinc finger protein [Clavispora lusitaniae]QFZ30849.1 putative CDC48-associated ubiquitin-like zinc finger protein [Clavispora lusitaniae]QFZ36517.1 putative CDC48-associated ubiquitin-like zinc finger protein [Clavispora lusitaniae]QFZ42201.1 putative CDC48-associated ubiquitin-like zinc finger protein [Clavispora lusitaniae]QFZ47877.1 putative CDC48-associated ubiquitin-like zinc finger protein [Clavispora lusitaniae]
MSTHNLFMTQTRQDNQGILNLGTNCYLCSQLDFLPFSCEFCNHVFCSRHRNIDVHNCVGRPQRQRQTSPTSSDDTTPVAALFPDKDVRRAQLDSSLRPAKPVSISASVSSNPFNKLTRFLHAERMRRKSRKPSAASELVQLKKVARGPQTVAQSDRVHLWALYVSGEDLAEVDSAAMRRGVWVSKNWSAGRCLDTLADLLGVANRNNATQQPDDRLSLFIVRDGTPELLKPAAKLNLPQGSTVYLVRGPVS